MTGNRGTEAYLETAIFALKFNAVFILTLSQAVRQTHKHTSRAHETGEVDDLFNYYMNNIFL